MRQHQGGVEGLFMGQADLIAVIQNSLYVWAAQEARESNTSLHHWYTHEREELLSLLEAQL
jgi:hypothetical protein